MSIQAVLLFSETMYMAIFNIIFQIVKLFGCPHKCSNSTETRLRLKLVPLDLKTVGFKQKMKNFEICMQHCLEFF